MTSPDDYDHQLPLVYVAGPLTVGDEDENVVRACKAADRVRALGVLAYVPHVHVLEQSICPQPYAEHMARCLAILRRCDAVYRLEGESPGADVEMATAERYGVPRAYCWSELVDVVRRLTDPVRCDGCCERYGPGELDARGRCGACEVRSA